MKDTKYLQEPIPPPDRIIKEGDLPPELIERELDNVIVNYWIRKNEDGSYKLCVTEKDARAKNGTVYYIGCLEDINYFINSIILSK